MKKCMICGRTYPDTVTTCNACFIDLTSIENTPPQIDKRTIPSEQNSNSYDRRPLISQSGTKIHVYGAVATVNQQQYYQSVLTKVLNAVFRAEAYQFGHTTFTSIIRVNEIVNDGYPEESIDLLVFGNIQGIVTAGDTIDATAFHSRGRYIIRSASINGAPLRQQARLPAGLFQSAALVILTLIILLIFSIISGNFAQGILAGTEWLLNTVIKLLPTIAIPVFGVWLLWKLLKTFFKG